jgi:3-deoxy-D-manno-octulosonate 8-phosphate phosphatase (KDO 8-P phosphatase)
MMPNPLCRIKLLLLDVDGVLTAGGIVYDDSGAQTKIFNPKDGLGIRLLMGAGIGVGIVTGRRSEALMHRCRDLGIELVFDGIDDKAAVLSAIEKRTGIDAGQMAYAGDDLPDLPLMKRVGVAVAVADAHEEVTSRAAWVTRAGGGRGAVREICEAILKAQGLWEKALEPFLGGAA